MAGLLGGSRGQGRINADQLNQQIAQWTPAPTAPVQHAPQHAAPAPVAKPTVWQRIAGVGHGINQAAGLISHGGEAAINTAARMLPGGQNDFKQQARSNASLAKNTQFLKGLENAKQKNGQPIDRARLGRVMAASGAGSEQEAKNLVQSTQFNNKRLIDPNTLKSVGKSIVQAPVDVYKQGAKQVKYLTGPAATDAQRKAIIDNQTKAVAAAKAGKYSPKQGNVSAAGRVKLNAMMASGANKKDVSAYAANDAKALDNQTKRGIGNLAEITSLAVGGGATTSLVKGGFKQGIKGFAKNTVANTAAGAAGSAGQTVATNPNATGKEIRKSAAQGGAAGLALSSLGKGAQVARNNRLGRTAKVANLVNNTEVQRLNTIGRSYNKAEAALKPNPSKQLLLGAGDGKAPKVAGDGFTMSSKADPEALHLGQRSKVINSQLQKATIGTTKLTPEQFKALVQERKDIKDIANGKKQFADVYPDKAAQLRGNTPTGKPASVGAAVGETSIEQKVARPPKEKTDIPLNGDGNFLPKSKTERVVAALSHGVINPIQSAANKGHVKFVNVVNGALNKGAVKARGVEEHLAAVEKQHKLDNHSEGSVSAELENGTANTKTAQMMQQGYKETGQRLVDAGVLKPSQIRANYAARSAEFTGSSMKRAFGLSKSISNAKQRVQEIVTDELGIGTKQDKYKTNADFRQAVTDMGGRARSDIEAYREYMTNAERAIRNANLMKDLKGVAMGDGRAAVVTSKNQATSDYKMLNDGAVYIHPDAHGTLDTLHQGTKSLPAGLKQVAALNSKVKRIVTYNAVVHGGNLLRGDVRERGLGAFLPHSKATAADVKEYLGAGGVRFEHDVSRQMDELAKGSDKSVLSRSIGKVRSASDKILFEKYGNHVAMESYIHARDKLLKNTNLTREEATKIAAKSAKASIMTLGEAERSVIAKNGSRLFLFAGQYFQSTFKLASRATALGTDKTLSKAAQRADMFAAQKQLARGAAYTFAAAQAMNYRATGRFTWQNHGSKILPVFYVDKATGKEYHVTNFYGQLGDLYNVVNKDTSGTIINKASPFIREGIQVLSNKDSLKNDISDTTASNQRQIVQKFIHTLGDFITPAGFSFPDVMKMGQPGSPGVVPTLAGRTVGFGLSSKNQDNTDKLVDKFYQGKFGSTAISKGEQQIIADEAVARNDIKKGNLNTPAVQSLKSSMTASKFNKFMKGGADSTTQRHFDALSTDQKLQIIEKLPKGQTDINTTSAAKAIVTSQAAYDSLISNGYTDAKIKADLQKSGFDASKLNDLVRNSKADKKAQSRASRQANKGKAKWTSPATR